MHGTITVHTEQSLVMNTEQDSTMKAFNASISITKPVDAEILDGNKWPDESKQTPSNDQYSNLNKMVSLEARMEQMATDEDQYISNLSKEIDTI